MNEIQKRPNVADLAELRELLGPPPALSTENAKAYDEIMARLMESQAGEFPVSSGRRLYRQHPQRRETCRSTGTAIDQAGTGDQRSDGKNASPHRAPDSHAGHAAERSITFRSGRSQAF